MIELRNWISRFRRDSPPRRYRIEEYKRWFPKTAEVFVRTLKRHDAFEGTQGHEGHAIGLVVVPWVSTAAPWYSIMLAIGLARRGRRVILLWDDTGFPENHLDEQNQAIGKVLEYVRRFIPLVRLSEASGDPATGADAALIDALTDQNLLWRLRGARLENDVAVADEVRQSLTRSLQYVRQTLDRIDIDCLVVPGGVYGTSGLFAHEARCRGCRVATFDSDRGSAQICVDGIAAQNGDIPRAFDVLWTSAQGVRSQAIEIAVAELQSRADNLDSYGFQALPSDGSNSDFEGGVLIPLNVEWDTAALGRHVHFENSVDWITSTVRVILDSDAGPVIVRQHPSERRPQQRSQLDVATIMRDRFGDDPRCRFVAADDPVNTYDLLRSSRLVLPFVSTIAIEAAAIGKPVLISGACYYADLGFVWSAGSQDEYFELLLRGLKGDLELLPDQSDRAWICYYLTAVRNRVATKFTAQPDDFWSWCRRSPTSLFAEAPVSDILEAIDRDVPISLLRHRRSSQLN